MSTRAHTGGASVGVVIVTWNSRDQIDDALTSIIDDIARSGLHGRVVVADSASSDGTAAHIARRFGREDRVPVHVLALRENLGFGASNNAGLKALGFGVPGEQPPDAVFLLNPDTITMPGATRRLYETLMGTGEVGLVGPQLRFGDGAFQHAAFRFPGLRQLWAELFPTPGRLLETGFNGRYPRTLYAGDAPFPADFVLGAAMMLRRAVVEATGGFDPRYFMYCEEIDWAWRIRQAGWHVLCEPRAFVTHLGGQSTGQVRAQSARHLWESRLRLAETTLPVWKRPLARLLIARGLERRAAASTPELADTYRALAALARTRQTADPVGERAAR